ncbi:Dual_specificity phosphatase [Hexamita inflata]|uniref:Dual specificity phosphatase n=1 Tax=Hexamita inflata TaxID=28002 RepID=A0AA86TI02_9EUKA|nr:Dual specificity phosphatase [Hexamita inflata]
MEAQQFVDISLPSAYDFIRPTTQPIKPLLESTLKKYVPDKYQLLMSHQNEQRYKDVQKQQNVFQIQNHKIDDDIQQQDSSSDDLYMSPQIKSVSMATIGKPLVPVIKGQWSDSVQHIIVENDRDVKSPGSQTFGALPRLHFEPSPIHQQSPNSSCLTARRAAQQKLDKTSREMSQVLDFLYLSGIEPATSIKMLQQNNIKFVLNLCGDILENGVDPSLQNLVFKVKDLPNENLSDIFYECFSFIERARKLKQNVLVHCHQGVSRSTAVVIGYLMCVNDLTFNEAFAHVRFKRNIVSPNAGFVFQLLEVYRSRHSNVIKNTLCGTVRNQKKVDGIISVQDIGDDQAIKDILESKLTICNKNNAKEIQYEMYIYSHNNKRFIKTKQNRLESHGIYIIAGLPIGIALFVGNGAETQETHENTQNQNKLATLQIHDEIKIEFLKFLEYLHEFEGIQTKYFVYKESEIPHKFETDRTLQYFLVRMKIAIGSFSHEEEIQHEMLRINGNASEFIWTGQLREKQISNIFDKSE